MARDLNFSRIQQRLQVNPESISQNNVSSWLALDDGTPLLVALQDKEER